jgi:hypothetical protein
MEVETHHTLQLVLNVSLSLHSLILILYYCVTAIYHGKYFTFIMCVYTYIFNIYIYIHMYILIVSVCSLIRNTLSKIELQVTIGTKISNFELQVVDEETRIRNFERERERERERESRHGGHKKKTKEESTSRAGETERERESTRKVGRI